MSRALSDDPPFSILDLVPVTEGSEARVSFANMVELARLGERLGYKRFWLAEHHNMPGIASAATAVLIGHVAGATTTIRVGAGGVMLPNHAPLQVAEQFGTLASLYPGRVDLGLGRAPGTDQAAARALRRYYQTAGEFPSDVVELMQYFEPAQPDQAVRAVPGAGVDVEVWILGSSLFGAQLSAQLGLPYSFASHFAPELLEQALAVYRGTFRASARLRQPYVMLALNVVVAETDAEARRLFTSQQLAFINLRRGRPGLVPAPVDDIDAVSTQVERAGVDHALTCAVVGDREAVRRGVAQFVARHQPDELLLTANIFDHSLRLRSFAMAAEVMRDLRRTGT
jgi:luciferase family oxidoreductase group 1